MSYQITRTGRTFSAKEAMDGIAAVTDDRALELEDYSGYVCDAVSEIADTDVSIYTADQIDYCRENPESARSAVCEGLALDGREYFDANPGDDYKDYEAHVGIAAWFMDAEAAIYADLADAMRYASLGRLAAEFGDDLDAEAWAAVDDATDWEDNNARIEDITDGAAEAYREALEGDDGEEG